MKMKYNFTSKIQKFLYNKTLLNFVVAISFFNIIAFIMMNQTVAIIYFILIGLVTSFFSKNMNVVLLVPLILVNLFVLVYSNSKGFFMFNKREGLENTTNSTSDKKVPAKPTKTTTTTTTTSQGLPITPLDHTPQQSNSNNMNEHSNESENDTENRQPVDEHFEVGRGKKNSKGYNIDYASTVEDAYDELNKILGSDGIKRLTSDTQNLMKQQLQLAESMKGMQPLIAGMAPLMQQAQGLLGSMGEKGNLGNLADIAKKFNASLANK
jgi:hypothetical protein